MTVIREWFWITRHPIERSCRVCNLFWVGSLTNNPLREPFTSMRSACCCAQLSTAEFFAVATWRLVRSIYSLQRLSVRHRKYRPRYRRGIAHTRSPNALVESLRVASGNSVELELLVGTVLSRCTLLMVGVASLSRLSLLSAGRHSTAHAAIRNRAPIAPLVSAPRTLLTSLLPTANLKQSRHPLKDAQTDPGQVSYIAPDQGRPTHRATAPVKGVIADGLRADMMATRFAWNGVLRCAHHRLVGRSPERPAAHCPLEKDKRTETAGATRVKPK